MNFNSFVFGRELNRTQWTPEQIEDIFKTARKNTGRMAGLPLEYIIDVLSGAGKLFCSKSSSYRKSAEAGLAGTVSFSKPVIKETLDIFENGLSKETLRRRVSLEMFLPDAVDRFAGRPGYEGLVRAVSKGVALHVGAGNIFLGIVDSLVLGILAKNANVVKVSSHGSGFPALFARALAECDKKGIITQSTAVLTWPGGNTAVEETALKYCDAVFVWGGERAVVSYKKLAPAGVTVTGFGPKASAGFITQTALKTESLESLAQKAAFDAAQWDQSACSSLHTVYLEGAGYNDLKKFADCLGAAFKKIQKILPQGRLSADENVEITKARELAKVDCALDTAYCSSSFPRPYWTVIAERDSSFKISPLNRVVYVKSVKSTRHLRTILEPHRSYIQTIGVAGTQEERENTAVELGGIGIARVTSLGNMLSGAVGSPHDGIFPLNSLVNWITVEGCPSPVEKLRALVNYSRKHSGFYKKHFKKIREINDLADFRKLPVLTKELIYANTPPDSRAMFTAPMESGVYFASGGSTGKPKYIFYDSKEYENVSRMLGMALEAGGLNGKDTAANLFVAGNLWSSFLTVEKALACTKAVSVPIGSSLPMESILKYLAEFNVTAIIGLPSFLLKTAEAAQAGGYKIPVRKIFFGGEYVSPAMADFFRKVFPGVSVKSAGYATVDAGVIGFQCGNSSPGVHHLFSGEQFLEILNSETFKPVKPGETGELFITTLNKRHMPMIRFRLGDLGRWMDGPCPCGRTEPRFEILGRCDDRIHIGGAHLFVNDLHNAVGEIPELSFNFQLIIETKGSKDFLRIKAETKTRAKNTGDIKKRLIQSIRGNCEDLTYVLERGWMPEPEIEILPPDSIPKMERTGKIKRVVDKRIKRR